MDACLTVIVILKHNIVREEKKLEERLGGGWLRSMMVMTVLERTCMGIRYIFTGSSNIPRGRETLFSIYIGWMGQE